MESAVARAHPGPAALKLPRAPLGAPRDTNSAEYRALALLVHRDAGLPSLTQGLAPGAWGVILDADETILDNSDYQRRRASLDSGYTEATWSAWVRERAAGRRVVSAAGGGRQEPALSMKASTHFCAFRETGRRLKFGTGLERGA